jgi:glycosyltransferase involved in cell wall biosynthesis
MKKLSAVIITRNDSEELKECIKNLSFADEVIVIDNNSEDSTVETAKALGAQVWKLGGLDFSYLRNVGREKAQGEWLLYIDTDERVSPELRREILAFIKNPGEYSSGIFERKNFFFNTPWPHSDDMTRLMKHESLIGWHGQLHETPQVIGKSYHFKAPIMHYTHDDLTQMVNKTNEWSAIEAQLRDQNNHPPIVWWRFPRVMLTGFYNSYIKQGGYKAGTIGLIESIYQAFSMFITYAKLWEKQNKTLLSKPRL